MKQFLKAYTTFTRTEKAGLLGLLLLIGILLTLRLTLPYWANTPVTPQQERELIAAFNSYKRHEKTTTIHNKLQQTQSQHTGNQPLENLSPITENNNNSQQNTTNTVPPAKSRSISGGGGGFLFDPNTIDSAGLRKLGLREKTTSIFLNWRRKGKRFYKKEELKKLYTLTPAEYNRLAPYITINNNLHARSYNYEEYGPMPAKVNINTADSITLIRLKGIGPAIAHCILAKRRSSGAFKNIQEVLSVYHFSDTVRAYLQQKLVLE